ncbi:MAG: HNH endonuclease, partial [Candidatus Paceibacterota bacterium]|jgi:5-methylcytosine-specific restriction endonuclease McrA
MKLSYRQKIGKANKKIWLNKSKEEKEIFSKKMREIALLKKYSPPSRKGMKATLKTKLKISKSRKGKKRPPLSKEWKQKISETLKYKYKIGEIKTVITKEQIEKSRTTHIKRYKNYIYKTKEKKRLRKGVKWKRWREAVFKRDNYTCQSCKIKGGILEPHHIKSWAKYPKLRFKVNNGLTLCHNCHKLTKNYGNPKSRRINYEKKI